MAEAVGESVEVFDAHDGVVVSILANPTETGAPLVFVVEGGSGE